MSSVKEKKINETNLLIWNPFRKGHLENPHEQLTLLREHNPVHKGINGRWLFFKYRDVKFLLTNPVFRTIKLHEQLSSKNRFLTEPDNLNNLVAAVSKWLFFLDPPEHTVLRQLVVKCWNQHKVQTFIEQVVEEAITNLSAKRHVEIVSDFAVYIPTKIICKILGLPLEDYKQLRHQAHHFANVLEPFESLHSMLCCNQNAKEFYEYIETIVKVKKNKPDDSFISAFLIGNHSLENPLNHEEMVSVFIILFFAGIETSIYLFAQSILHLIHNPSQLQMLRNDLSLTYQAIEELIRYSSPLQYAPRTAKKDIEIRGQIIRAGEMIMGCVASANRDPDIFENPEKLDFTRKSNPHLSFGHGFHHCIGAKLARDELGAALPAFIKRFSKIELDPQNLYEWETIIINRGLKSLPVVLNQ